MLNRDIILYQAFEAGIRKTKHKAPEQETKEETIHIALYLEHYFTYELTIYHHYAAMNYEQVKRERAWVSITGYNKNTNKYIRRRSTKKTNSLKLVYDLHKQGMFIQGDMKAFHKTESSALTKNQIFLDVLEYEQMGNPREINYIKDLQEGKQPEEKEKESEPYDRDWETSKNI